MYHLGDTIAAIASAAGEGPRGVVRLSGPQALDCVAPFFHTSADWHAARRPCLIAGVTQLPEFTSPLPVDVYLWPTSRSYTGEPIVELHTLGSPPLLAALLRNVCLHGARIAQPGEFTLRAFLSGRLDLTQAEAVLGVIDAAGPRQLEIALAQLAGGLTTPLTRARDNLLDMLAELEAGLDFSEEDIEFISRADVARRLNRINDDLQTLTAQLASRSVAGEWPRVVLAGAPNAGKSSLFNYLAGHAGAIVSPIAGTTRDYLTARVDIEGRLCELVDTAGVEDMEPVATVDRLAQEMAAHAQEAADVLIVCVDATDAAPPGERLSNESAPCERIDVLTKIDLAPSSTSHRPGTLGVSSMTGAGIEALRLAIAEAICRRNADLPVAPSTAARCHESIRLAHRSLAQAEELTTRGGGEELIAAELHVALHELGKVVGTVYTDDVLDRIFSRFCIGK